jgi:hypothetical protein
MSIVDYSDVEFRDVSSEDRDDWWAWFWMEAMMSPVSGDYFELRNGGIIECEGRKIDITQSSIFRDGPWAVVGLRFVRWLPFPSGKVRGKEFTLSVEDWQERVRKGQVVSKCQVSYKGMVLR